jgi:GAG-pre-integrase domain
MKIGSVMMESRFNIIIMSSLLESYRPTLQTITASERVSKLSGMQSRAMKADNLIAFIIKEAQHCVINDDCMKSAELALAAQTKNNENNKGKKKTTCKNCERSGHGEPDCYQKGGDKEGQAPWQQKTEKGKETDTAVVGVDDDENNMFTFMCPSDYADVVNGLDIPKSRLGTCMDSGASQDYCPDRLKFTNYKEVCQDITTADRWLLTAIGMGDLHIELPNRSHKTKVTFKNAIHAPGMAFTLISISRLDKAGYSVLFSKGMCAIQDLKGQTIATISHSNRLYKLVANQSKKTETVNMASTKMSINEAHRKLGHIAHSAVKDAITKEIITGIELNLDSKVKFCKAYTKAKLAH